MKPTTLAIVIFWFLAFQMQATAQVTFAPPSYVDVNGPLVDSIVSGDFDGDGRLDLISLDVNANTVTLLRNNGGGSWGPKVTLTVGPGPTAIHAADLNEDNKLDIISANLGNGTLTVLTNNGTGLFSLNSTLQVGSAPRRVTATDVNGDGKLDLISSNSGDDTITVLLNGGNGTFGSGVNYSAGLFPTSVATVDANLDGKNDLVVANSHSNTLTVLTNSGTGVFFLFTTLTVDNGPWSVLAVDLDDDGKKDLVTANLGNAIESYTLSVLKNNGTAFGSSVNYTVGKAPNSVAAADFNGDGKLDLVCANQDPTQVDGSWVYSLSMLTNSGNGAFQSEVTIPTETSSITPYSAIAADIDGDGKTDLIYADQQHAKIVILINTTVYPTPPNLGIGLYENQPAVFYPIVSGRKPVLQMTTNLSTGEWVTVTNGIPLEGIVVTNSFSNAFFRLK